MADVDWDSVTVIGSRSRGGPKTVSATEAAQAKRSGSLVTTDKKTAGGKNAAAASGPDHARIAKLDRENEVAPPETVDMSVGRAIAKARQDKEPSMTQKDLAQKINETQTVIQSYENGKAIPSPAVLGKMERVLGVKLRGKDIGQSLAPKGKDKDKK